MASPPLDPDNPFHPPRSRLGTEVDAGASSLDVEATRRAHLVHEVLIESLGSLGVILAIVAGIVGVVMALVAMSPESPSIRRGFGFGAAVSLAFCALSGGVGYGLGRRQPWARFASAGLLGLLTCAVVARIWLLVYRGVRIFDSPARLIPLGILVLGAWSLLFLLYSPKGRFVFSRSYEDVVSRTDLAHEKASPILLLAAVLVLVLIAASALIPLVNPGR